MGTSLTGQTKGSTYDALLKITDNGPVGASLKTVTDGLGNDSALQLSSAGIACTGTTTLSALSASIPLALDASKNITQMTALDNVAIGATTPSTGKFTTLQSTGMAVAGIVKNDASGNLTTTTILPSLSTSFNGDVRVTSNTTSTNTATFADITGLTVALAAGTSYYVEATILGLDTGSTTARPYLNLDGNGGLTITSMQGMWSYESNTSGDCWATRVTSLGVGFAILPVNSLRDLVVRFSGVITTNVAGNLAARYAMFNPASSSFTIYSGSVLSVRKIS